MAKSNDKVTEEKTTDVVAPIESVDEVPVQVETNDGPVLRDESETRRNSEDCWNCDGKLNASGKCPKCGFDKSLLYNLDLEAEKAIEREKSKQS